MTADVPDNSPAAAAATSTRSNSSFLKSGMARLLLSVAAGILFCGCHKKSEAQAPPPETAPAPTTAAANATPTAHGPVAQPLPASSQTIAANATTEEAAGQLTLELRRYVAYTRNIPKSFEDFAVHDPIKFPPPPPGKKYVLTGGKIVLQ